MSTRRPTIFILSNMRDFGGAERSIAALLPGLAERANLRVFVSNERHYEDLQSLGVPRMKLIRLTKSNSPVGLAHALFTLIFNYLREWPVALLANGHKGGLLLALMRCLGLARKVATAVFVRDFGYYALPFILRRLPDAQYFAPTAAIFKYPQYLDWGLTRHRHEVMPNAVKLDPRAASGTAAADEPFFACCARITPWKGIEYLIRAWGLAAPEFPRTPLHIYGEVLDQAYYDRLTALVAELGLGTSVRFQRFARDIGEVYRRGLFFVIPSLSTPPGPESFCRIIIEAWSYGKPLISFAVGGPKELIHDGEDGFLVEEKDTEALAERIRTLLREPERCARMGAAGLARVHGEFDPATIAARLFDRLTAAPEPLPTVAAEAMS